MIGFEGGMDDECDSEIEGLGISRRLCLDWG